MSAGSIRRRKVRQDLFNAGYEAYKNGKSRNHNPEPRPYYPDHRWWADGWDCAERESRPKPSPKYTVVELKEKLDEFDKTHSVFGHKHLPFEFLEWLEENP